MDKYEKERRAVKRYLKKYPFLKEIWDEAEEVRENFYALLDRLEKKMEKLALKHGIQDIRFACLGDECQEPFGIDIGDVQSKGQNIKEGRILIYDSDFWFRDEENNK